MPRQALVAPDAGVANMIIASSADFVSAGFSLAPMPNGTPIDQIWEWTLGSGFAAPRVYAAVNNGNHVTAVSKQRHSNANAPEAPPGMTIYEVLNGQDVRPGYLMTSPGVFVSPGGGPAQQAQVH